MVIFGFVAREHFNIWHASLAEFGIEYVSADKCVVSKEFVQANRGYNDASQAAIERKFGADFWKDIEESLSPEERRTLGLDFQGPGLFTEEPR